jgi:hypothetical protein
LMIKFLLSIMSRIFKGVRSTIIFFLIDNPEKWDMFAFFRIYILSIAF